MLHQWTRLNRKLYLHCLDIKQAGSKQKSPVNTGFFCFNENIVNDFLKKSFALRAITQFKCIKIDHLFLKFSTHIAKYRIDTIEKWVSVVDYIITNFCFSSQRIRITVRLIIFVLCCRRAVIANLNKAGAI